MSHPNLQLTQNFVRLIWCKGRLFQNFEPRCVSPLQEDKETSPADVIIDILADKEHRDEILEHCKKTAAARTVENMVQLPAKSRETAKNK